MKKGVKSVDEGINATKNGNLIDKSVYDPEVDYEDDGHGDDYYGERYDMEFEYDEEDVRMECESYIEEMISHNVKAEKILRKKANYIIKSIGEESYNHIMRLLGGERIRLLKSEYDNRGERCFKYRQGRLCV